MDIYKLLIIFTDGEEKTIDGVVDHTHIPESKLFTFTKNGYRGFIPNENVKYIGRAFDWRND